MRLDEAGPEDLAAIAALMNRAYRGAEGWATEAGLVAGERTNAALLATEQAEAPDARLLILRNTARTIVACVRMQPAGEGLWMLGALTVDPALQAAGLGRRLLAAAEGWAIAQGGTVIRMTVLRQRAGLIAWYRRRGYHPTGATQTWPYGDARFGLPLRDDLAFLVLEKRVD